MMFSKVLVVAILLLSTAAVSLAFDPPTVDPLGGKASEEPCSVDLRAVAQLVSNTGAMQALKESSTGECQGLLSPVVSDFRAELLLSLSVADSQGINLRPNFRVLALPEKAASVRFDVVLRVPTAAGGTPVKAGMAPSKDRVLGSFGAYRADGSNLSPEEYKIGKHSTFSVVVACDVLDSDGKKIAEMTVIRTYRQTSAGIEQIDNQSGRFFSASERALATTLDRLVSP